MSLKILISFIFAVYFKCNCQKKIYDGITAFKMTDFVAQKVQSQLPKIFVHDVLVIVGVHLL